jgi:hypothetical protein
VVTSALEGGREDKVLVGHKDLKAIYDLHQRDRSILFPVFDGFAAVGVDNEVLVLALVVDLALGAGSTGHLKDLKGLRGSISR